MVMMRLHVLLLLLVLLSGNGSPASAFVFPARLRQLVSVKQTSASQRRSTTQCQSLPYKLLGVASCLGYASVKLVGQGDVAVVERLGKFHKRLDPGLHFIIPVMDRVRAKFSTRENVFDIPPQKCITTDNAPLLADAVVYWTVEDPAKALYSVMNLELAIQNLVLTQLRSEIGKLTLDATFSAREQINAVLLVDLDEATKQWGVKISRVEVRDILPNKEIMKAMEMQMAAERTKRAVVIKSEGERSRAVNEAEGIAQARLIDARASAQAVKLEAEAQAVKDELEAEGSSKALDVLTQALDGSSERAAQFQLVRESIAAQRALAISANAKVIIAPAPAAEGTDVLTKAMAMYDVSK